jgi:tetraacyldisaccharide 4'-kinase
MNFNAPLLRPVRILLFPFSLLYGVGVWLRNKLFDKGFYTSSSFNLPVIGVGNLSAGGTGKSPMVEFLLRTFQHQYKLAVLSRGYKRKTTGYALAGTKTTALEIGDEPTLFYNKFPSVAVAVGEERIVAIPQLLHDKPETNVIILDDAFQHRYVKAGLDILLTDYNNLFTRDWFLPTGDLRDMKSSYKRASVIVVTKCKPDLSEQEKQNIIEEIGLLAHQHIFFSCIDYGAPYHIITKELKQVEGNAEVLLVTGIANPRPLKKYLFDHAETYYEMTYNDHHVFSIDDWKDIRKRFDAVPATNKMILTTEKDAVRLTKFSQSLADYPFYVIPMQVRFLFNEEQRFTEIISTFISGFNNKKATI